MIIIETCPKCGHDLVDSVICTNPPIPKKECHNCGWTWEGKRAPLKYDAHKKGFYYTEPFSIPSFSALANEENYSSAISKMTRTSFESVGEVETLQMQIPYSAEIEIKNKLGVLELKDFIVSSHRKNIYLCEFHNIDLFLGMLFTLNADAKILSPSWLAEKAISYAERLLKNNKDIGSQM